MLTKCRLLLVVLGLGVSGLPALSAAESYNVDPVHSSVTFMVQHLGLTYVHGRFNDVSGSFVIDRNDPSRSSFTLTAKVESVDTNNKKRDDHLRGPDFFNAKESPLLTFQSTGVKVAADGYEVTGDLTLHGVKKSVSFVLKGGKTAEFPKGMQRTGFSTGFVIKRSDFGMKTALEMLGDEVHIAFGFEGVKQ